MEHYQQYPGQQGQPQSNGMAARTRSRAPTVNEALPFSPFSSIVPFDPDIIPAPVALPSVSTSAFGSNPAVKNSRNVLQKLSAGATSAEKASNRCQQTLRDVQKLLDPESLTQYKFRAPRRNYKTETTTTPKKKEGPALSPFAKMVFDNTNVDFRYLTPESEPRSTNQTKTKTERNGQTAQGKVKQEQLQNGYMTPGQTDTPSASQIARGAVVTPSSMSAAQRAQYQCIPESDSAAGATNGSPANRHGTNGQPAISRDQKLKGDATVDNFQTILHEIFEAEDRMQPDTSGLIAANTAAYFSMHDVEGSSVPILQSEILAKLESLTQKVCSNNRIDSIDTEHLTHIQRLCETTASVIESSELQIGDDWNDDAAEEWSYTIASAERSLVASRILLRIMGAGAHIKELQSEDFLRIVLTALRLVTETCIVPIVEERSGSREQNDSDAMSKFKVATTYRKALQTLLHTATKTFRVMGEFLTKSDVDESSLSSVEYLCKLLIFAENASGEKDSVVGVQNFETMRRCAMDVFAKIFAKYTNQRQFIFDEVLISLEKLPATKQSSRQFRELVDKPIQLVSALLMRLVQTSASYNDDPLKKLSEDDDSEDAEGSSEGESDDEEIKTARPKKHTPSSDLETVAKPLHDSAQANASYIVKFLIQRALTTSKSSDEPYRRLLDIFTADFLNVLGSSEWPSAELLLRTLVLHMVGLVESPKSTASSRYMALELLGTMGAGILELQISARNLAKTMDSGEVAIARRLTNAIQQLEAGNEVELSSLVSFEGPYRMVIEYIQARTQGQTNRAQLQSAHGYHLSQWASYVYSGREGSIDSTASDGSLSARDLSSTIRSIIVDPQWLEANHDYPSISTEQGRLAAMVLTLSSKFCKAFNRIFSILLSSMSSEQPTIRSRSLKSVAALLDTDPSILDRNNNVLSHISRCANDPSSLVRSSAISLFEKCTLLRPALDSAIFERVISRTRDATVPVRKNALSLLKKIYLRNESQVIRAAIASATIARMEDTDETVVEIARQTMEEIWFQPLYGLKLDGDRAIEAKLQYGAQAALLVQTVEAGEDVLKVLESLLKHLLRSKSGKSNSGVCKMLVHVLFDGVVDVTQIPGSPSQDWILHSLMVFAKACPQLFTATQLERLEPYTQNLSRDDNLEVYRSVVTILRHTMPHQTMLKDNFMLNLQIALLTSVARLPKSELPEVVNCIWTITGMINDSERLVKFLVSVMNNIYNMKVVDFNGDAQKTGKIAKLMGIAGQFGKVCDLDAHLADFKARLPWYKGDSVSALVVEVICPFASPKRPLAVRVAAMDAVCTVAQNWPKIYMRADVNNAFDVVFKDREPALEEALLAGLEGFFCPEDEVEDNENIPELGSGVATGTERLVRTYVATDRDGASIAISQRFLKDIMRLALSSCDEAGLIAGKILISINKQSFVLPKESAPALVALETCPNAQVANLAFKEHRDQHAKRESLFEKEYMRAIQKVFEYQCKVVGSDVGFTGQPPVSKMHLLWAVLKSGKAQVRKKFLTNYSQKLGFNLTSLDTAKPVPTHLMFVRFCVENLAFFEYDKTDEILHLLGCLEMTFSGTGTSVAQAIESDVLRLRVDMLPGVGPEAVSVEPAPIDPVRLRQLAVASQICSLIWETRAFLIRLWNMQKQMAKAKKTSKDPKDSKEASKTPHRANNAPNLTDAYLKRITDIINAHASPDTQLAICHSFVELISVDTEVKVDSEGEELENGYDTPSEGTSGKSPSMPPSGGGGKSKRKKSISSTANTPRKKRRSSHSGQYNDSDDDAEGEWE